MSVIEGWLKEVHDEKGSDLFVTADAPPCIKVNGKIRAISTEVLLPEEVTEIVKSIMTKKQIREFDETLECQFAIALGDDVRFRVSAFYQQAHVGMPSHRPGHHGPRTRAAHPRGRIRLCRSRSHRR